MKQYSISERQAIKDRLADEKYFERDRQLLVQFFPRHSLVGECNRVNAVNRLSLCRRIIYQLLTRVDEAAIVANRTASESPESGARVADGTNGSNTGPSADEEPAEAQRVVIQPAPKKPGKTEEFPHIDWTNNENPDIQLAILLYDERVNTWHSLCELRAELDDYPEKAMAIAELDDRNRMAQHELEVFQDTGIFPCKHPLAVSFMADRKQMDQWRQLRKDDTKAFLRQVANLEHNITRYKAELKKNLKPEQRKRAERNLANSIRLNDLMQRVLNE